MACSYSRLPLKSAERIDGLNPPLTVNDFLLYCSLVQLQGCLRYFRHFLDFKCDSGITLRIQKPPMHIKVFLLHAILGWNGWPFCASLPPLPDFFAHSDTNLQTKDRHPQATPLSSCPGALPTFCRSSLLSTEHVTRWN